MQKNRGFTLIELVVVMVIIGVLAVVSVPTYRNYVRRAAATEGTALVGAVANAMKIYRLENSAYYSSVANTSNDTTLGIDVTANKYFNAFTTVGAANSFTVTTTGANPPVAASGADPAVQVQYSHTDGAEPTITVSNL